MKANLVSVFVNAEAFQNVLIFWFDQKDLILVLVLVLDRASFKKRSKKSLETFTKAMSLFKIGQPRCQVADVFFPATVGFPPVLTEVPLPRW